VASSTSSTGTAPERLDVVTPLFVTVSRRLPGLLGPAGWTAVSSGRPVVALPGAAATAAALREGGRAVADVAAPPEGEDVVVLAAPDEVPAGAAPVAGAPEPSGAGLLDVVAVMDRLRSPGGCPWDAEQTHASLRGYLLEEAHEAYDAIVDDDAVAMREELGDVLLQVVFHARVAAEAAPDRRFDVDDVARDLVDKLVRRHPHVFGDAGPRDVAAVEAGWEEIKQAEKQRRSPTEGVSRTQPAASWGAALVRRAGRADLPTPEPAELTVDSPEALGERLLGVVAAATARGWDVEDALREAVRRYAGELDAAAQPRPPA
jgi:XTP/dITP diphosphohydrolase